jgi:hypothetical protein
LLNLHKIYDNGLLRQNKLFKAFNFKGQIWKILTHPDKRILVIEIRVEESRTVKFVAADLDKHALLWEYTSSKYLWWCGLEWVEKEMVFLHGYKDIQHPEHQGIIALDLYSGMQKWENAGVVFRGMAQDQVVSEKVGEVSEFLLLDKRNGKVNGVLQTYEQEVLPVDGRIRNAAYISPEDNVFHKIAGFIKQSAGKEVVLAIDYMEHNRHLIAGFYTRNEAQLCHWLLMVNENGEVVFCELTGAGLPGIARESFFVFENIVIFIKNKTELVTYKL